MGEKKAIILGRENRCERQAQQGRSPIPSDDKAWTIRPHRLGLRLCHHARALNQPHTEAIHLYHTPLPCLWYKRYEKKLARTNSTTHSRCRSCISRPTRLMTCGDMFSNDDRSDIFLLLMTGMDTARARLTVNTSVVWAPTTPLLQKLPLLAGYIRRWVLMMRRKSNEKFPRPRAPNTVLSGKQISASYPLPLPTQRFQTNAYSRPNSRARRLLLRKAMLVVGRERASIRLGRGEGFRS